MVTREQAEADPREYLGRDCALSDAGDLRIDSRDDLQRITFYDNLQQAINIRLATPIGTLGLHPLYGCRLNELLGQVPTEDLLMLAKAYVRAALLQEPRIESINNLVVVYHDEVRDQIDITLQVQPINELVVLDMVWSIFLIPTT